METFTDWTPTEKNLTQKGYHVKRFPSADRATQYLCDVCRDSTVGFGDSMTLLRMGLYEALSRLNTVPDPQHPADGMDFLKTAAKCLSTEYFFTSANAVAQTGEIVNIDGSGNRIAGSLFGHKKVFFIITPDKLAPSLEQAIWLARNVAAPQNARRLGLTTPCALGEMRCYDCSSPERICSAMCVHFKAINDMESHVIFVDTRP